MSFCIAKIIDGEICIHADSLISGDGVIRHNAQRDSALKAVLIHHQFCILYAGNVSVAEGLINHVKNSLPLKYRQLILLIYNHHVENDCQTDYIIASTFNRKPRITAIKNGHLEDKSLSSWIGSKQAFNCFQKHSADTKEIYSDEKEAFSSAFSRVLSDGDAPDVGGFQLSIEPIKNTEKYQGNPIILNYQKRLNINTIVDGEFMKRNGYWDSQYANAGNGGFDYSILQSITIKKPGLGFYFGYVQLGLLYSFDDFGLYPRQYRNCTGDEFVLEAQKLGITLSGVTLDSNTNLMHSHNEKKTE